jgi:hypothetical protein
LYAHFATRRDLREAYDTVFRETIADLRRLRGSADQPPFSDELASRGLMGAFQQMLARASLDEACSWRDVVTTTLGFFLAPAAAALSPELQPQGRPRRRPGTRLRRPQGGRMSASLTEAILAMDEPEALAIVREQPRRRRLAGGRPRRG